MTPGGTCGAPDGVRSVTDRWTSCCPASIVRRRSLGPFRRRARTRSVQRFESVNRMQASSSSARALAALCVTTLVFAGCATGPAARPTPATPAPGTQQAGEQPRGVPADTGGAAQRPGGTPQPRPYNRVITPGARTQRGLFSVHQIGERLYFEI